MRMTGVLTTSRFDKSHLLQDVCFLVGPMNWATHMTHGFVFFAIELVSCGVKGKPKGQPPFLEVQKPKKTRPDCVVHRQIGLLGFCPRRAIPRSRTRRTCRWSPKTLRIQSSFFPFPFLAPRGANRTTIYCNRKGKEAVCLFFCCNFAKEVAPINRGNGETDLQGGIPFPLTRTTRCNPKGTTKQIQLARLEGSFLLLSSSPVRKFGSRTLQYAVSSAGNPQKGRPEHCWWDGVTAWVWSNHVSCQMEFRYLDRTSSGLVTLHYVCKEGAKVLSHFLLRYTVKWKCLALALAATKSKAILVVVESCLANPDCALEHGIWQSVPQMDVLDPDKGATCPGGFTTAVESEFPTSWLGLLFQVGE